MISPPRTRARWLGAEIADAPEQRTRSWTNEQVDAVVDLAQRAEVDGLLDDPAAWIATEPTAPAVLVDLAAGVRAELIDGRGFIMLGGFPLTEVDERVAATAFLLFGRLVGLPCSQNAAGHLLGHVRDVGAAIDDPKSRIYQTNQRQTFHTDSADAVGLLCLRPAPEGGLSMLVSVEATYAIMVERRPDLAARLFDPVATDRRDEQREGEQPWFDIPVLSWHDGRLTVIYQHQYIKSAARFADAPGLDEQHAEALDLFDEIMNEAGVHLRVGFAPGDMQFVHNHSLLHDRTGFVDDPDPDLRRHLLRLWLCLPGDRELPEPFAQRYGSTTVGDRGGIVVAGTQLSIPLDAS